MRKLSFVILTIAIALGGFLFALRTYDYVIDLFPPKSKVAGLTEKRVIYESPAAFPIAKVNSLPKVRTQQALVMDRDSAYVLFEKNASQKVPIASLTKIMTALVILENYKLDEIITVPPQAVAVIGSDIQLVSGEKMKVYDLLWGLLLRSGNDAAIAFASKMGTEKFVTAMNDKAKKLGLRDTKFVDPAGLEATGYSTAHDLALLSAYALRNELLAKIVATKEFSVASTDGRWLHKLENTNRLLFEDKVYFPGTVGIKTGYTVEAGHCIIAAAQRDGHVLIAIVLKTDADTVSASAIEARKLLDWGFNNFIWRSPLE